MHGTAVLLTVTLRNSAARVDVMGNEAEANTLRDKAQDNVIEVNDRENSFPDDNGSQASAEGFHEDFRDSLKETPIMLPLVQPTIPSILIEGSPYDSTSTRSSFGSLCRESSVFSLSETLDSDQRDRGLDSTEEDDRRNSLRSGRSLSVSFGDVTVCGLPGGGIAEQRMGWTSASLPNLDDLPYINEIILSAATPALGPDNSRGRPKSLGQILGSLPEWLANKKRYGSLPTLNVVSKPSTLDAGSSFSLPRSVAGRQEMKTILTQMHGHRLARGDYHPRVLRPSVSLGAFGDWKDVENPTLTVSFLFLKNILYRMQSATFQREGDRNAVPLSCFLKVAVNGAL